MFHKKPLPHPTSPQKDNSRQKKETQLLRRTKGIKKRTLIWVHLQIIPSFSTFVAASSSCNTAVNIPFLTTRICIIPLLDPIAPKILNLKVFNIQNNSFVLCFLFPLFPLSKQQFPISTKKSEVFKLPLFPVWVEVVFTYQSFTTPAAAKRRHKAEAAEWAAKGAASRPMRPDFNRVRGGLSPMDENVWMRSTIMKGCVFLALPFEITEPK